MSAGIKSTDSGSDKFAKILPADVTAAFLGIKSGIDAVGTGASQNTAVIYSFLAILIICPFYFRILMNVTSKLQNLFLCLSFIVFGLSIGSKNLIGYMGNQHTTTIEIIATVAPILWSFLVAPMFLRVFGNTMTDSAK